MSAAGDTKRVIAYASRRLWQAEKNDSNYSSMKLELLALKWAVAEKFRGYLLGSTFVVLTDNNPLFHLQTAKLRRCYRAEVAQLFLTLKLSTVLVRAMPPPMTSLGRSLQGSLKQAMDSSGC